MQDKALLAIEYYQKALPIFEKHSWLESQTILHHNVAELWLTMGNNEKAEQEYLKAIETGEASGDSLLMVLPRKGLVKIYISEDDYDKALQTVMPAYQYYKSHRAEEVGDYPEVLASMVKIHLISGHKDLAKARSYAVEALSLDSDELMFETHADINAAAALVAIDENKWEEALRYALKSVHENDDEATYSDVSCYDMIAQIYVELGDKANARVYINKVVRMMERFATENYQSALSQMEVLYETEKKEEQIALMNRAQVYYNWSLIAAAVLIVMLIVVLVYRHQAHRRQKALLAAKVALETETKERRILARDLHDSLGGMLSLLRLKMEEYKQKIGQSDQPDEVLPLLDATHTELRRVSHHLMPEELLRNGLVSALHDFAISVPMTRFQAVGDIRLDKDRELVLYRCAYEMVNNAVKHADASRIDIQLIEDEKSIVLTVSDDGKGMTEGNSSGMGLQNISERIEPFSGEMRVITSENDGTEINIILPL
jgi:signal transduction histidine kinase